jgi:hypothetical protein
MSHQADDIAKIIEQMIDIKLRAHDREHHSEGIDERRRASANNRPDQDELRAIRINLADTLDKLFSS